MAFPSVIFTATTLPDGTWADLIHETANASAPASVIVVSRLDDVGFYLKVIEAGAFDYVVPPFTADDTVHVLQHAMNSVLKRSAKGHR